MTRCRWALIALTMSIASSAGCGGPPDDRSAAGALRLFFESVAISQDSTGSTRSEALEAAYDLLDEESRERLAARARSTGALGGRQHDPWEMLAAYATRDSVLPSRASSFRESIDGDGAHATVTVHIDEERTIEVPMVREGEGWRVVLGVEETIAE
jgi:hypothetical protein